MKKNVVEVVIDGKLYYLGGEEPEEFMHQIASYLNAKIRDLKASEHYLKLPPDMQSFHLALSVADEYMCMKNTLEKSREDMEIQGTEMYRMKNELVELQIKNESLEKQLSEYRDRIRVLEEESVAKKER